MRIFAAVVLLTFSLNGFAADKSDAAVLISAAEKASELRIPGTPAFRLKARLTDGATKKVTEYVLLWASPVRWREEVTIGPNHQVRIGNSTEVSQDPNIDAASLGAFGRVHRSLWPSTAAQLRPGERILDLRERTQKGASIRCVRLQNDDQKRELCFDPDREILLAVRSESAIHINALVGIGPTNTNLVASQQRITSNMEYFDFQEFAGKLIPRRIRLRSSVVAGTQSFEYDDLIEITELATSTAMSDEMFVRAASDEVRPWCRLMQEVRLAGDFAIPAPALRTFRKASALHAYVDRSGLVRKVRVIGGTAEDEKRATDLFNHVKVHPATCGTEPVEGDFILSTR